MKPLACLVLVLCPLFARADDLLGTVRVDGQAVHLTLSDAADRPVPKTPLRLLLARRSTVAVARTDGQGRWSRSHLVPGSYEVVVEPDRAAPLRLPFLIPNPPPAHPFPWASLALGLGLFLAAIVPRPGTPLSRLRPVLLLASVGLLLGSAWIVAQHHDPSTDPDVAQGAREFLQSEQVRPLSVPLAHVLATRAGQPVPSQPHPLLNQPAPDFELSGCNAPKWHLHDACQRGPVVLVFYFGYHCNHCVGQLFALQADLARFRELGATVVAVSADPPPWTAEQFRRYGPFTFPTLADPDNCVAQAYSVFRPASGKSPEEALHGTFVIDRAGLVRWVNIGGEPFTDDAALLVELARCEGRLPGMDSPR